MDVPEVRQLQLWRPLRVQHAELRRNETNRSLGLPRLRQREQGEQALLQHADLRHRKAGPWPRGAQCRRFWCSATRAARAGRRWRRACRLLDVRRMRQCELASAHDVQQQDLRPPPRRGRRRPRAGGRCAVLHACQCASRWAAVRLVDLRRLRQRELAAAVDVQREAGHLWPAARPRNALPESRRRRRCGRASRGLVVLRRLRQRQLAAAHDMQWEGMWKATRGGGRRPAAVGRACGCAARRA